MDKKKLSYFKWSLFSCSPTILAFAVILPMFGVAKLSALMIGLIVYAIDVGHSWKLNELEDRIKELETKIDKK